MSESRHGRRLTGEDIERLFVGPPPRYTLAEVAAESGISEDLAARIWRALGFVLRAQDAVAFSEADVNALRRVRKIVDSALLKEQAVVRMARALGQTTARLAQWQADIVIGTLLSDPPDMPADLVGMLDKARELVPDFEHVLIHVWRTQLGAASTRLVAFAGDNDALVPTRVSLAVGFADLVSFTKRSRELDMKELAELVEGFESRASDTVACHGGRLVKTLGDEVMFTATTSEQAAAIALDLAETEKLRIGMAYGPVVPMMGDVFGTTVNLAARLTVIAKAGTAVVDEELAEALKGHEAYALRKIRHRPARGLGVVQPYVLRRSSS